ncbi:MAG: apolipoprotein N-acyltransferase [Curvibacter sp.]|nr:MAG: apolipoprotein N-acyltransferase [Curvibacter sp.]
MRSTGASATAHKWKLVAIVFVAACAQSASVAWPFEAFFVKGTTLWWLQLLAQASAVAVLLRAPTARAAAGLAWCFSTVWLSTTFWWLFIALHNYGGLPSVLAVVAIVALAAALGLYYASAGWLLWRWRDASPALLSLGFASLWTMAELARGTWLTGFGWGAVGYAHIDGPLAWYMPWVGSYGVGWLAALAAAILGLFWRPGLAKPVLLGSVLVLPLVIPPGWNEWTQPTGRLSVTLLQGNIPQDEKFETGSGVPVALRWYAEQLVASRTDLVVAPETAVPLLPQQLPEGYWAALQKNFVTGTSSALVGIPLGSFAQGYTNSVLGLTPGQTEPWRYDKHHLVPFGEFIPPLFKWFTRMMNIPLGDFNRGSLGQPSLPVAGERVAPNICYEDLYGEELASRFADAALAPTIFANVSNLGWFNDSIALDQHLNISRARALEFQRPFVRATNTGATAILDYQAKVQKVLPARTRGVLVGEVQGRSGVTPFAWWAARFGLWPMWLMCMLLTAVVWRTARNAR